MHNLTELLKPADEIVIDDSKILIPDDSTAETEIIPLIWSGICLPITYWFGFKSSQMMGIICIFPMVYLVKFFEDGPGLSALPDAIFSYLSVAAIGAIGVYIVSLFISMAGYSKKK